MAVQENLIDKSLLEAYHDELMKKVVGPLLELGTPVEGYMRVAGSSDPALSYKHYQKGVFGKSWTEVFYPCLIGTKLTGNDAQVGKILFILKKLGARRATASDAGFTEGQWVWEDLNGTPHAIDGSEGDIMVCNIRSFYELSGRYTVDGTEFDLMLRSLSPFTFHGYEAAEVAPRGDSPDYTINHTDTDNVQRMHSVYNPSWSGSYDAPNSMVGTFVFTTDEQTGEIVETYDASATILGGSGGCHTTNLTLYDGEQRAMNQNPDTTKTYPFMNHTARAAELQWSNLAAEGGTFDAHKKELFGSCFSSNDGATAAADWAEGASAAKNGMRVVDKNGASKHYSLNANTKSWMGKSSDFYAGQMVNSWRSPFKPTEAYRALCYAVQNGIQELVWFTLEGNKYKWRSVPGFAGPSQGEATAVVFKQVSSKCASNVLDPTDKATSIEGNRIDFLYACGLYHGVVMQQSPSWWASGLLFTEDENGQYEAYMERDQTKLLKSVSGDKNVAESWPFETDYKHVGTFAKGEWYRKNYSNDAFMLPDTNANKSGGGLHTYVCGYNYFTGTNAGSGKKSVRGFRRGYAAIYTHLSPLCVGANLAPSASNAPFAFGTCVRIVEGV